MTDEEVKNSEQEPATKRPRIVSAALWDIPTTSHYRVSYMHRNVVSGVVCSQKHGYVLTASDDGIVKFWKRLSADEPAAVDAKTAATSNPCLEFVKSFTAHVGAVLALTISHDGGDTAASVGEDSTIKLYDVSTFDVTGMIKTNHKNLGWHASFIGQDQSLLAVSSDNQILIFSMLTLSPEPTHVVKLHAAPITAMAYHTKFRCMISADLKGVMELWDCTIGEAPVGSPLSREANGISYQSKMDTDWYELMKKRTFCMALALSPSGNEVCVVGNDLNVRIYNHGTGRIMVTYDERPKVYDKSFGDYGMDAIDYGKRAAVEREISQETIVTGGVLTPDVITPSRPLLNVSFDATGNYLLMPTCVGIKLIDWSKNKLVKIIGKSDANSLRFLTVCLCSGDAKVNRQLQLARSGGSSAAVDMEKVQRSDALIVACAFRKKRLYVFSHDDPMLESDEAEQEVRRDVLNEPPDADDRLVLEGAASARKKLGTEAILRTTMGDIHFKLFTQDVPRTIENFCGHAKSGYYDNTIFHRVIKGFMLQTGDPLGDGTGGESIWGGEFEDEFVPHLRHDRPFTVSMANAGPGTNGSQFFITTVPTPWLDNKHTVFGRVTKGMDVCMAIENVKTDDTDKPLDEINIQSVDIL